MSCKRPLKESMIVELNEVRNLILANRHGKHDYLRSLAKSPKKTMSFWQTELLSSRDKNVWRKRWKKFKYNGKFAYIFKFLSPLFFARFYLLKTAVQSVESSQSFKNFLPENAYTHFLSWILATDLQYFYDYLHLHSRPKSTKCKLLLTLKWI